MQKSTKVRTVVASTLFALTPAGFSRTPSRTPSRPVDGSFIIVTFVCETDEGVARTAPGRRTEFSRAWAKRAAALQWWTVDTGRTGGAPQC